MGQRFWKFNRLMHEKKGIGPRIIELSGQNSATGMTNGGEIVTRRRFVADQQ